MSVLVYNGITFGPDGWRTLSFSQEAMSDASDTETECMKITITGECILAKKYPPEVTDGPAAKMPGIRAVKAGFMQRRKGLSFKCNGVEMIPSMPSNYTVDCRSGPVPLYFNATMITEGSFVCQLAIESYWAEASPLAESGKILSHRWRETVEIDENLYSHKTRSGKVVISANYSRGKFLDGLRDSLITTSIDPGFLRTSAEYTISESGLHLDYTIKDSEQYRMPPFPAATAQGNFQSTTQRTGSPGRRCEAAFTLTGSKKPEAAPSVLVDTALLIAGEKCKDNGGFFPFSASFHEDSYRNQVTVKLGGMTAPVGGKAGKGGILLMATDAIGTTPRGSNQRDPVIAREVRGTANLLLHAAAYHDPTLAQTLNREDNQVDPRFDGVPGG